MLMLNKNMLSVNKVENVLSAVAVSYRYGKIYFHQLANFPEQSFIATSIIYKISNHTNSNSTNIRSQSSGKVLLIASGNILLILAATGNPFSC